VVIHRARDLTCAERSAFEDKASEVVSRAKYWDQLPEFDATLQFLGINIVQIKTFDFITHL
jgi:hypothetical protein